MSWIQRIPASVARAVLRVWPAPPKEKTAEITGLNEAEWRELRRLFPLLGRDPAGSAARARRSFAFLARHDLGRERSILRWEPAPPDRSPAVYLTIHMGNLRMLRYFLRRVGITAATIVDETHFLSPRWSAENAAFDRRYPCEFPHDFFSGEPHRLRHALRNGSLIAAVDRIHSPPPGRPDHAVRVDFLGGALQIDLTPVRLARLAGVPARAIFMTAPKDRLIITVGEDLPDDPAQATARFAEILGRVARASPGDFDGFTHRFLLAGFRSGFLR